MECVECVGANITLAPHQRQIDSKTEDDVIK